MGPKDKNVFQGQGVPFGAPFSEKFSRVVLMAFSPEARFCQVTVAVAQDPEGYRPHPRLG